jgi:hypothetical protein
MSDKMMSRTELYDISTDASQQNNIVVQLPEKSSSRYYYEECWASVSSESTSG